MPKAPPSGRAYRHVSLSHGLVNIPISIYSGTVSDHGITRKQYVTVHKDDDATEDHPVGSKSYDKVTMEDVDRAQIIKKVTTEYGDVYVEDSEIEKLFDLSPDTLEIKEFQPLHLFHQGHYVPEKLYYVEPRKAKAKKNQANNDAALMTILKAMREEGALAVCELVSRGNPHPAILLPDGTLWQVYHTDALREQRPLPEVELPEVAIEHGKQLIETLWSTKPADLTDERTALIQDFADKKARAGDFGKPEIEEETKAAPEPDVDFLGLLAASVEQAKAKRAAGE